MHAHLQSQRFYDANNCLNGRLDAAGGYDKNLFTARHSEVIRPPTSTTDGCCTLEDTVEYSTSSCKLKLNDQEKKDVLAFMLLRSCEACCASVKFVVWSKLTGSRTWRGGAVRSRLRCA